MKSFNNIFFSVIVVVPLLISGCDTDSDDTSSNRVNTLSTLNDTGLVLYTQQFPFRDVNTPAPTIALTLSIDVNAPGQDADHGKDASTEASNDDGTAGFKFTKLDNNGIALSNQGVDYSNQAWQCIKDEVTGLIWEVKTSSGLQNTGSRYTWYEPNEKLNGGNAGSIGESAISYCADLENCNTNKYIQAINGLNEGKGLCNSNKWRLPLREELRSLIDYSIAGSAMIDTNFFPNTAVTDTWTSQTAFYQDGAEDGSQAWEVHFDFGKSESHAKDSRSVAIRLVY